MTLAFPQQHWTAREVKDRFTECVTQQSKRRWWASVRIRDFDSTEEVDLGQFASEDDARAACATEIAKHPSTLTRKERYFTNDTEWAGIAIQLHNDRYHLLPWRNLPDHESSWTTETRAMEVAELFIAELDGWHETTDDFDTWWKAKHPPPPFDFAKFAEHWHEVEQQIYDWRFEEAHLRAAALVVDDPEHRAAMEGLANHYKYFWEQDYQKHQQFRELVREHWHHTTQLFETAKANAEDNHSLQMKRFEMVEQLLNGPDRGWRLPDMMRLVFPPLRDNVAVFPDAATQEAAGE